MVRYLTVFLVGVVAYCACGECRGQEPKEWLSINGRSGSVYSIAFSPDGKLLASGSEDEQQSGGIIKLYDVKTGKVKATFKDKEEPCNQGYCP